jgi:molecular chaperone GrpE
MTAEESSNPSETTSAPETAAPESAAEVLEITAEPANEAESAVAAAAEVLEATADDISSPPEELSRQLAEAQKKITELQDAMLRQQAEQENLRRRMQRDLDNARKYALERFASDLLPVKDSLEMGMEAAAKPDASVETMREGSDLIVKMLQSMLEKFNITEINPLGQKFNAESHEAMVMLPNPDMEPGTVMVVHQKGYRLNDRLLRPARVVVAKAAE